jgi:hypothetical protein
MASSPCPGRRRSGLPGLFKLCGPVGFWSLRPRVSTASSNSVNGGGNGRKNGQRCQKHLVCVSAHAVGGCAVSSVRQWSVIEHGDLGMPGRATEWRHGSVSVEGPRCTVSSIRSIMHIFRTRERALRGWVVRRSVPRPHLLGRRWHARRERLTGRWVRQVGAVDPGRHCASQQLPRRPPSPHPPQVNGDALSTVGAGR